VSWPAARAVHATPAGRLVLEGEAQLLADARAAVLASLAATPGAFAGPFELAGRPAWLKAEPIAGRACLRHALRAALLRRPPPRLCEARNLAWLADHAFRVPRPLAAGVLSRRGLLVHQCLFTERLLGVEPLDRWLRASANRLKRDALLDELAREAARMHALGFVHRDLHARNVLVAPPEAVRGGALGEPRRLVFVDAWRGGLRSLRGPAWDLGCLMLEGAVLFTPSEARTLLVRYFTERERLGRPASVERTLTAAARARSRMLRRIARQPGRWRQPEPPPAAFDLIGLMRS
jgi:hypothetical protein